MIVSSPLSFCRIKSISKNAHKRNETQNQQKGQYFSKREQTPDWQCKCSLFLENQSLPVQSTSHKDFIQKERRRLPQNCNGNRRTIQDFGGRIQATARQAAWELSVHRSMDVQSG